MTTIDIATLIALICCAAGLFFNSASKKRADQTEAKEGAAQDATIIAKLDAIKEGQVELKADIKGVRGDVTNLAERLIIVEQSTKSAHKRLDRNQVGEVRSCE